MEIYCYRVVYPSGVFVRVTPDVNGEKTGEVITCGATFKSTKSLVLDGVNYVQLQSNRGWIFSSLNGIKVLELVDLVRTTSGASGVANTSAGVSNSSSNNSNHNTCGSANLIRYPSMDECKTPSGGSFDDLQRLDSSLYSTTTVGTPARAALSSESSDSETKQEHSLLAAATPERPPQGNISLQRSTSRILKSPLPTKQNRVDQLWKEVRLKTKCCSTFDHFTMLVTTYLDPELMPPAIAEPGPARSAWMASCSEPERKLSSMISTICGVTRQCADTLSDTNQLESHLWIMCHLGASEISHVIKLLDKAAQVKFDNICFMYRDDVLHKANEVWQLAKPHALELTKTVATMLADDVKNFLQRWILLKVIRAMFFNVPSADLINLPATPVNGVPNTPESTSVKIQDNNGLPTQQPVSSQLTSSYISLLSRCEPISGAFLSPQAKAVASKVVDVIVEDMKSVLSGMWGDPEEQIAHVM